jgi:hypothetical protein
MVVQIAGCAAFIDIKESENQELPALNSDKSRIVFMRSSMHANLNDVLMYEIVDDKPVFFGALKNNTKFFLDTTPGKHTLMTLSVGSDYAMADLTAGKTYYVMVTPRGWPAVNFSFRPFRPDGNGEFKLGSDEFNKWQRSTKLIENVPASFEFAKGRQEFAEESHGKNWPKWQQKPDADKAVYNIRPQDGT